MTDSLIPFVIRRFTFFHSEIFKLGFLLGFVSTVIVIYKIKQAPGNEFKDKLMAVLYTGLFWTGFNMIFYHVYYSNMMYALSALPQLIAMLRLAWFMVSHFGIGGNDKHE